MTGVRRQRWNHPSTWGLRRRLMVAITLGVTFGAVALLAVQWLVTRELLRHSIATVGISRTETSGTEVSGTEMSSTEVSGTDVSGSFTGNVGDQVTDQVLGGLAWGSLGLLVVFVGLGLFLSWWLGNSLRHMRAITTVAAAVGAGNLDQRVRLTGADAEIQGLADTFDAMLDRLDAAFTAQRRFIQGAAHELRTPLATERMALEAPLYQGQVPDSLKPAFEAALAANYKQEHLVAALLRLAQVEAADGVAAVPVDLIALMRELVGERAETAEAAGVTVALEPGRGRPAGPVATDPDLLRLAIGNLLDNAIGHNVTGGRVKVTVAAQGDRCDIVIVNTGEGLTEDQVARLAEPFNRGDRSRLAGGGLGLGLTLVDAIARKLGGGLTLAANPAGGEGWPGAPGGGLTARFTLPVSP
ncbi:MAG: HAMP domain-containing histidine kinase [Bifidobacteriaceae bacterium]|jgi:signal transduction histidine kinase|nr:HAMP domain-containing histidine kinase [Bifidobacteriaceae bacterium]